MTIQINGTTGISGVDGSAGTPAIQGTDTNTGISFGTDEVNINTGGTARAKVDSSGRLLVGTSSARSPLTHESRIQLEGTDYSRSTLSVISNASDGSGPTLLLGKSRSGSLNGNTIVQNGDDLGQIYFLGADGSDLDSRAATIKAQVDGTPGANDMPGRLVFSTTRDSQSSPEEKIRITNDGHTIYKATSGNGTVTLGNSDTAFVPDGGFGQQLKFGNTYGASKGYCIFTTNGTTVGTITANGTTGTAYNTSSDYRLKENVVPLTGAADRLNQLQVSRFNFIADPDRTVDGFIAHEAQAVVPECVTGTKDEVDADGNPIYQGIDQSKLVPLLTAALQEALAKIETLEGMIAVNNITIDEMQGQLTGINARLTALEGGTN